MGRGYGTVQPLVRQRCGATRVPRIFVQYTHTFWCQFDISVVRFFLVCTERSLAPIQELLPKSPLTCLQFSPSVTTLLVAGSFSGALSLFDHRSGAHPTASCNITSGHSEAVTGVTWSAEHSELEVVSVSTDRQVPCNAGTVA